MKQNTIILSDPHPVVREGLRSLFGGQGDLEVVAECENSTKALTLTSKYRPNLLVMEIAPPEGSARQLLQQLQRKALPTAVLIVSAHKEEQYAATMIQAGARGFVSKTRSTAEIMEAARKVMQGGVFISAELAQRIALSSLDESKVKSSRQSLSAREQEVLLELASGHNVTHIAQRLHVSPKTISTHKTRICQKLGLRSTFELVRYTLDHGIL